MEDGFGSFKEKHITQINTVLILILMEVDL